MEKPIKIAITGAESTGKTFMTSFLASHFKGLMVEEMARKYLLDLKKAYDVTDIYTMAKLQIKKEEEICRQAQNGQFVFIDTELINFKIWLEAKKIQVPLWIIKGIEQSNYDIYLLMYPDIPWEQDDLRENEHSGKHFFNMFESNLKHFEKTYQIIQGNGNQRQENAINIINKRYF